MADRKIKSWHFINGDCSNGLRIPVVLLSDNTALDLNLYVMMFKSKAH
jgi:hypothetical protein